MKKITHWLPAFGIVLAILLVSYASIVWVSYSKVKNASTGDDLSQKSFEYCTFENMASTSAEEVNKALDRLSGSELQGVFQSAKEELQNRKHLKSLLFGINYGKNNEEFTTLDSTISSSESHCEETKTLLLGIQAYNNGDYQYARNLTYYIADKYKDNDIGDIIYFYASVYEASSTFRDGKDPQAVVHGRAIYDKLLKSRYSHIFAESYMFAFNMLASDLISVKDYGSAIDAANGGIAVSKEVRKNYEENFNMQMAQLYYSLSYSKINLKEYSNAKNDINTSLQYYDLQQSKDLKDWFTANGI